MSSNEPEQIPGLTDAKLRALAEFAAGAGHEINNPVATIAGYVQQLLPGEQDPDRIQILETIGAQAYRIRDMIGDIMLFARPPQPRPVIQNLAAVVEEVCGAFAAQAGRKQLQIDCSIAPALTILADAAQIRVLLSELLRNALDAAVPRGRIVLEGGQIVDSGRAFARLTIADDGRGIPDAVLPHLFDPFFSGRQAGRGLGFGLAKAWRIATLHAATLSAESPAERGAVFTLKWPLES